MADDGLGSDAEDPVVPQDEPFFKANDEEIKVGTGAPDLLIVGILTLLVSLVGVSFSVIGRLSGMLDEDPFVRAAESARGWGWTLTWGWLGALILFGLSVLHLLKNVMRVCDPRRVKRYKAPTGKGDSSFVNAISAVVVSFLMFCSWLAVAAFLDSLRPGSEHKDAFTALLWVPVTFIIPLIFVLFGAALRIKRKQDGQQ